MDFSASAATKDAARTWRRRSCTLPRFSSTLPDRLLSRAEDTRLGSSEARTWHRREHSRCRAGGVHSGQRPLKGPVETD
jgi:hypothetical protein